MPGRFIPAIKYSKEGEVKFKARYGIGGYRDKQKHVMVHTPQTMQPASIRLLPVLAEIHGVNVWASDVTHTYLQSAAPFTRDFYIENTAPEFELSPNQRFKLLNPFYGFCDAGDLWWETLDRHYREDLNLRLSRSDPALCSLVHDGILHRLS